MFIRVARSSTEPFSNPSCIAIQAAWTDRVASLNRVPGCITPFNFACGAHSPSFLGSQYWQPAAQRLLFTPQQRFTQPSFPMPHSSWEKWTHCPHVLVHAARFCLALFTVRLNNPLAIGSPGPYRSGFSAHRLRAVLNNSARLQTISKERPYSKNASCSGVSFICASFHFKSFEFHNPHPRVFLPCFRAVNFTNQRLV